MVCNLPGGRSVSSQQKKENEWIIFKNCLWDKGFWDSLDKKYLNTDSQSVRPWKQAETEKGKDESLPTIHFKGQAVILIA